MDKDRRDLEELDQTPAEEINEERTEAGSHRFLDKVRVLGGKLGQKAGAAAEKGWEKTSDATADGWDKVGRFFEKVRGAFAKHPVSPLVSLMVLALFIGYTAFHGMYTRAYVLNVDGVEVGVLENEEDLDTIVSELEAQVTGILGEDYAYDAEITLTPVYTAASTSFSDTREVEAVLLDGVGAYMDAYAISVDGEELGYAPTEDELYEMLDEVAQPWLVEGTVDYSFVEDVEIYPTQVPSNTEFDVDSIQKTLSALETEEAYYEVELGDTFNGIAYSLDMTPAELSALNPDVEYGKIWAGDQLKIQQSVPCLSVVAVTSETYEEVIESPVEYIETADLYVGNTSVKEQGSDGVAQVTADVTYLNGVEQDRTVLNTETIEEATTTYIYTGTTPKPATASNGYFIWPVRGTITSYFGARWGSTHLGLDIGVPYGTTIKAADGGVVICAGWKGSYGNLVAIQHDNGMVTYYGHNSSVLVSVGQRVYQGQAIALAGSTGNSTGPHCHFEVRVNGTSVDPLSYLR